MNPKHSRRTFLGVLGGGVMATQTGRLAAAPLWRPVRGTSSGFSRATLDRVQQMFNEVREKHNVAGAGLSILDGADLHEFATGVRDVKTNAPVTPNSIFFIGSTTKAVNATLVMQLVDEGKLDLDTPVKRYLPELKLADPQATESLTMRHLLGMTSGIDNGPYLSLQGNDAVEWYVAAMATVPQIHPPGAMYGYSNAGSTIAGRVVEVLTGLDWDTALTRRLLRPLGLKRSAALLEDVARQETVTSHGIGSSGTSRISRADNRPARVPSWWDRAHGPAGSTLRQSAGDLMRFGLFHLSNGQGPGGSRVMAPRIVKMMQEPQSHPPKGFLADSWSLGWMLYDRGGTRVCGHAGGHTGQGSDFWFLPDRPRPGGAAIVVNSNARAFYAEVMEWVFRELFNVDFQGVYTLWHTKETPDPSLKLDLEPYTGVYERYGRRSEVTVDQGALVLTSESGSDASATPVKTRYTLRPVDRSVFAVYHDGVGPPLRTAFTGFTGSRPDYLFDGPYTPFLARRTSGR